MRFRHSAGASGARERAGVLLAHGDGDAADRAREVLALLSRHHRVPLRAEPADDGPKRVRFVQRVVADRAGREHRREKFDGGVRRDVHPQRVDGASEVRRSMIRAMMSGWRLKGVRSGVERRRGVSGLNETEGPWAERDAGK